jgi:hypothetical protein
MSATTAQVISKKSDIGAFSMRWIINAREDLVWFVGSVLSSYAMLAFYVSGLIPLVWMVGAWAVLIDAPHVFGTFSRTYFDRTERNTRGRLLWGSLLFFVVGPLMVLAGVGFIFFFIAALWAYYHLVKQHYGFMVLYKKKNGDLLGIDNLIDRSFLMLAFTYPFIAFVARDPEAMERVPAALHSGIGTVETALLIATILSGAVWLIRQVQRGVLGLTLNVPKYLLLAAAIPMHWIVLLTPMPHKPIAIVAILTIYHNLQYHRLIWFHNKKYTARARALAGGSADVAANSSVEDRSSSDDLRSKYGAAELISRRLIYYIGFGILFGIWYQLPRQYMRVTYGETTTLTQLVAAFFWGYAFIHYYLDSKIWRVRRDPEVGKALQMS